MSKISSACPNKIVLDKSYRLPVSIHKQADNMVRRLMTRQPKTWSSTEEQGSITWHGDIMDVDIRTGEWLILARTNYIANRVASDLKDQGYLYWREESGWSISPNVLSGIEMWLDLCRGQILVCGRYQEAINATGGGCHNKVWQGETC